MLECNITMENCVSLDQQGREQNKRTHKPEAK